MREKLLTVPGNPRELPATMDRERLMSKGQHRPDGQREAAL